MGVKFEQHFLKSEKLLREIANFAGISTDDIVLEIGSGTGNLTKYLTKAKKIYAVEIDKNLFSELKNNMKKFSNVECINTDILKYKFPSDVNKIVGNLPYEISSPITEKILKFLNEQKISGKKMLAVLMYQLEFAERMTSFPGLRDYSRLSVLVNYYAKAKIVKRIPKTVFRPAPKVESALVVLHPLGVKEDKKLFELTKLLFTHKNKNVINALINSRNYLKIKDKQKLKEILQSLPENLAGKKVFYLEIEEIRELKEKLQKQEVL